MIDPVVRAFRGIVRSPVRSLLVVVLLAAGISFALTSVALAIAAGDQIDKIKLTTGVEAGVSISPQQFQQAILAEAERAQAEDEEFDRSRINELIEPLTAEHAEAIAALPYVRGVQVFTIAAVEYDLPGVEEEEEGESEEEETPNDAVKSRLKKEMLKTLDSMARRSFSASAQAPSKSVEGTRQRNSSPPYRPRTSLSRMQTESSSAKETRI